MATRKQAVRKAAKKSGRGAAKSGNPFAKGGRFYKGDSEGAADRFDKGEAREGEKKSLKSKVRRRK